PRHRAPGHPRCRPGRCRGAGGGGRHQRQALAASETGPQHDTDEDRAVADLRTAEQRAWWDPYTDRRLARQEAAWARTNPDPSAASASLREAVQVCASAVVLSPYRPAIVDGCNEVWAFCLRRRSAQPNSPPKRAYQTSVAAPSECESAQLQ